ncbi:MAG: histone H1 [Paracoccaceae bacterium]
MTDKPKRPRDANQLAKFIVDVATGEKNPIVLSDSEKRPGGEQGGKARAESLTKEQRKEIARIAADARWKKN